MHLWDEIWAARNIPAFKTWITKLDFALFNLNHCIILNLKSTNCPINSCNPVSLKTQLYIFSSIRIQFSNISLNLLWQASEQPQSADKQDSSPANQHLLYVSELRLWQVRLRSAPFSWMRSEPRSFSFCVRNQALLHKSMHYSTNCIQ